jgi:hypothetical protein
MCRFGLGGFCRIGLSDSNTKIRIHGTVSTPSGLDFMILQVGLGMPRWKQYGSWKRTQSTDVRISVRVQRDGVVGYIFLSYHFQV